jgi:hypothetical protein
MPYCTTIGCNGFEVTYCALYLTSVLCALGFNVSKKVLLDSLQKICVHILYKQMASNKEEFYDFETSKKVAKMHTQKNEVA